MKSPIKKFRDHIFSLSLAAGGATIFVAGYGTPLFANPAINLGTMLAIGLAAGVAAIIGKRSFGLRVRPLTFYAALASGAALAAGLQASAAPQADYEHTLAPVSESAVPVVNRAGFAGGCLV
jgi:hypothetical protein